MSNISHSSAIGRLTNVMICTHHDIAFDVRLVSMYQWNLGLTHWKFVRRILHCLKGTTQLSLTCKGYDIKLVGYTNANWDRDL